MFEAGAIRAYMTVDKSQFDKAGKEVQKSQKRMAVQASKSGAAFKKMWKQVAAGIGITAGLGLAVRGLVRQFRDTIQTGREFEREWANVTTMLSVSQGETEALRQELRRLSPVLGDTADLAKGMYQVLSASIEPAKAIRFLSESARAAKAGITDTKTAVDALTTVINAYGMEAEAVTEISDMMFATVKRGKLTYAEMANALGTVVPVAAKVGLEFKEVAAAMATLTRQGIDVRTVTMQLRQVIMSILGPSTEAEEMAKSLGIEWSIAGLKAKGLSGFLKDVEEKTGGNVEILRKLVPNVRALTAVLGLGGEQLVEYAGDVDFLAKSIGFTAEAMRKQMRTMDFWVEAVGVAADKMKIAFYEGLISQFRDSIINAEDAEEKVTEATNNMADSVSMYVSSMVESFGLLKKAVDINLWPLKKWKELLAKLGQEGDTYTEIVEKQRLANERLAGPVEAYISSLKDLIALHPDLKNLQIDMISLYEDAAEAAAELNKKTIKLTEAESEMFKAVKDGSYYVKEIKTDYDELFDAIDTTELDLMWEGFEITQREAQESFRKELLESLGVHGVYSDTIKDESYEIIRAIEAQTRALRAQATYTQIAISGMQSAYEDFFGAMFSTLKTMAQAWIVETIMEDPSLVWYAKLAAAAGAVAAVEAIYAGIAGKKEGGWVGLHGEEIIKVGEGGPEYINSNDTITNVYGGGAPDAMPMRVIIQNKITIGEQTFYKESVRSINKAGKAGDLIVPIAVTV